MSNKSKNIIKWITLVLASWPILMSATFKLSGAQQLIEHYAQLHVLQYMKIFGLMELAFVTLFLYPKTQKIGLLLLTAYFGGAIATELSHGNSFIFPAIILIIVWIAAALRKPSLFAEEPKQHPTLSFY